MTGMVGTALYVSPEVQGNTKATYNQVRIQSCVRFLPLAFFIVMIPFCPQKVDLFSLGIILFEMSYRPMTTGAERISVLSQLRGVGPSSARADVHQLIWMLFTSFCHSAGAHYLS